MGLLDALATVRDVLLIIANIVTGRDDAVKWLEPDRIVYPPALSAPTTAPNSSEPPAATNIEEDD